MLFFFTGAACTTTVVYAYLFDPSVDVARINATPRFLPIIIPFPFTKTTFGFDVDQTTVFLLAFVGFTKTLH